MTSHFRLKCSFAAAAAAAAVALAGSPLHADAASSDDSHGHSSHQERGHGNNGSNKHGNDEDDSNQQDEDGSGEGQQTRASVESRRAQTSMPSSDSTNFSPGAAVQAITVSIPPRASSATTTAPIRGALPPIEPAPGAIPIAVQIGEAAIAQRTQAPSLGGLIALPQSALAGFSSAPRSDKVDVWEVIAVAEAAAALALGGTLLYRRRRSTSEPQ